MVSANLEFLPWPVRVTFMSSKSQTSMESSEILYHAVPLLVWFICQRQDFLDGASGTLPSRVGRVFRVLNAQNHAGSRSEAGVCCRHRQLHVAATRLRTFHLFVCDLHPLVILSGLDGACALMISQARLSAEWHPEAWGGVLWAERWLGRRGDWMAQDPAKVVCFASSILSSRRLLLIASEFSSMASNPSNTSTR